MKSLWCFILGLIGFLVPMLACCDVLNHSKNPFHSLNPAVSMQVKKEKLVETNPRQLHKKTHFFGLKFADGKQVYKILTDSSHSFLTESGKVSFDLRTNTLIVYDEPNALSRVAELLKNIDIPSKTVEIEARIAMVSEGALDELGVQWGVLSQHRYGSVSGNLSANDASGSSVSLNQRMSITLPASSANSSSIAFQLASLGKGTLLDMELSALQSESKADVISSPRLITTNNQPAFIEQGTEIPYLESNKDGEQSIAFKKAVLSLKVTPTIHDGELMTLDLLVTQDRPGQVVKTGTGEAVAIITQRIGTQIMAENGETIVLGGIFQKSMTYSVDKVPLLGDLPLVGALFRRTYEKTGKSELLIFVTPRLRIQ